MRSSRKRWRTKTAASLLAETDADSVEEAVVRLVQSLREAAREKGFRDGLAGPPYDPWPLAASLGASKVEKKTLGFGGRIVRDGAGLAIEIDNGVASQRRHRFAFAHEVGHLALWKVSGKVVKTASRRGSRRSEIEELCNKIASEVLAPRSEVLQELAAPALERGLFDVPDSRPEMQTRSQGVLASVVHISRVFGVSLQFSAVRIREVSSVKATVALVHKGENKLLWSVGKRPCHEFLPAVLGAVDCTDEVGFGSYWASSPRGGGLRKFVWRRARGDLVLVALDN